MWVTHLKSQVHADTEKVILDLLSSDGVTSDSNDAIIARTGMTRKRFDAARAHSLRCRDLGEFAIGYRHRVDGRSALALIDPTEAKPKLKPLIVRSSAVFAGLFGRRKQQTTEQSRGAAMLDAAAREALAEGNKPLSDALGFAASDIRVYGDLQPVTRFALASVGVSIL